MIDPRRPCLACAALLLPLFFVACGGGGHVTDAAIDAATSDAAIDAAMSDAAMSDAGADAAMSDASADAAIDAAMSDAGADAAMSDAGADAAMSDAGADAAMSDAATSDASVSCTVDVDCPDGTFCRDRREGGRECVPFQPEGGFCGGFSLAWGETRCGPGATCNNANPLIADAPGVCSVRATLAELAADPARYDGHVVAVLTGWVVLGLTSCTELACSAAMPCCNTCNSDELLAPAAIDRSGVRLEKEDGTVYACSGNECDPAIMCEVQSGNRYRVFGVFDAGRNTIVVSSITRLM